jgi:hypothetical protein
VQQLAQIANGVAQHGADKWTDDVAAPHRAPDASARSAASSGRGGSGRQKQHVERSGAGAHEDGWTLAIVGKGGNEEGERTGFMGTARTGTCHHEPDRLLSHNDIQSMAR